MNEFATMLKYAGGLDDVRSTTLNGAPALSSTLNPLVDLFGVIGAMRNRSENDICKMVEIATREDPVLTLKMIFYARDIRGGLGERRFFRIAIRYLAENWSYYVMKNIHLFPEYGRYDDWYCLIDTPCEGFMWDAMRTQFRADLEAMDKGKEVSLLAKWIKTPDASSQKTRKLGILTAQRLGYSVYTFKRLLRKLRKYIRIVEAQMSAQNWAEIDYKSVPARAAMIYRNAFNRHDEERYCLYLEDVAAGKSKINASTLYPYDIVEKILYQNEDSAVLQAQWDALPNYIEGENNFLVMADVSGSMSGRPMATSIGLALYFAERNKGAYHNLFMTFSEAPQIVNVKGRTLKDKIRNAERANWGMNTDLNRAFERILYIAKENNVPQNELPKSLIIISDMEIDNALGWNFEWETFYERWEKKFAAAGYRIPNIVFWNVNAMQNTFHADSTKRGVQLCSGQSASTFKTLLNSVNMTPVEYMLSVLNSDRYAAVTV